MKAKNVLLVGRNDQTVKAVPHHCTFFQFLLQNSSEHIDSKYLLISILAFQFRNFVFCLVCSLNLFKYIFLKILNSVNYSQYFCISMLNTKSIARQCKCSLKGKLFCEYISLTCNSVFVHKKVIYISIEIFYINMQDYYFF